MRIVLRMWLRKRGREPQGKGKRVRLMWTRKVKGLGRRRTQVRHPKDALLRTWCNV